MNRRFAAGETLTAGDIPTPGWSLTPYGPEQSAGDIPTSGMTDVPYGPTYEPVTDWFSQYKWWVVGGGVGLFLLAGGSLLGLSLRKKRRGRR